MTRRIRTKLPLLKRVAYFILRREVGALAAIVAQCEQLNAWANDASATAAGMPSAMQRRDAQRFVDEELRRRLDVVFAGLVAVGDAPAASKPLDTDSRP